LLGLEDMDRPLRLLPRRYVPRERLAERGPFWADSGIELRLRVYDFTREIDGERVSDATALGTALTFRSGRWRERVRLLATWHTSFGLDAPDEFGGTGLLGPDQSDISVLSRAFVEVQLTESASARLYRQDFNLPYLNRDDSRMIPNTHEAYIVRRPGDRFEFTFGHVTKIKRKDSDRFVPMGEVAGVQGSKSGTSFFAVRGNATDSINLGINGFLTKDLFTTVYAESSFKRALTENWGLQLAGQFSWQRSHGKEQLGQFNTSTWGLRGALSYRAAVVSLSRTAVDENAGIRSPFGGRPSFASGMIYDFDRAGEDAWRIRLSQNFTRFGLPGFTVKIDYTEGRGAIAPGLEPLSDESAWTLTADYQPQGRFEGLWLRLRYGEGDRSGTDSGRRELRFIANYTLPGAAVS
jgi:hypothetical protein